MAESTSWLEKYERKLNGETPFSKAYSNFQDELTACASVIRKHGIQMEIEEGWVVDLGQQYRVMLRLAKPTYEGALFRAYIDGDGRITFDFGDEQATAIDGTNAETVALTIRTFLERDSSLATIQQLSKLHVLRLNSKKKKKTKK